jgi:hypothetical protein
MCYSKAWWEGMTGVVFRMKTQLCLRSEPVMMTLAGVVPLHEGVIEEYRHIPHPLRVVFPGENKDHVPSRRWRRL